MTTVESGKRALEWLGVGNEASSKVFLQCIDICHFAVGVFHFSVFIFFFFPQLGFFVTFL